MSSSEFTRLKDDLKRGAIRLQFLKAVDRFLKAHPLDGGADSDLVYMVGDSLASQNVWELVPPRMLAQYVKSDNRASLEVLLETVPGYFDDVVKEWDAYNRNIIEVTEFDAAELLDHSRHVFKAFDDPIVSHRPRIKAELGQLRSFYSKVLDPVRSLNLKSSVSILKPSVLLEGSAQIVYVLEHDPQKKGFNLASPEARHLAVEKKKPKVHTSKIK